MVALPSLEDEKEGNKSARLKGVFFVDDDSSASDRLANQQHRIDKATKQHTAGICCVLVGLMIDSDSFVCRDVEGS